MIQAAGFIIYTENYGCLIATGGLLSVLWIIPQISCCFDNFLDILLIILSPYTPAACFTGDGAPTLSDRQLHLLLLQPCWLQANVLIPPPSCGTQNHTALVPVPGDETVSPSDRWCPLHAGLKGSGQPVISTPRIFLHPLRELSYQRLSYRAFQGILHGYNSLFNFPSVNAMDKLRDVRDESSSFPTLFTGMFRAASWVNVPRVNQDNLFASYFSPLASCSLLTNLLRLVNCLYAAWDSLSTYNRRQSQDIFAHYCFGECFIGNTIFVILVCEEYILHIITLISAVKIVWFIMTFVETIPITWSLSITEPVTSTPDYTKLH